MKKLRNRAFTLVELIVVITILAILGTIAFIALQGYSRDARDSTRIADLDNIKKTLELFNIRVGNYPEPSLGAQVTYSGAEVWTQGVVGDSMITNIKELSEKPVDPLTGNEYSYSRLNTGNEYEIGAVLEGAPLGYNIIDSTYALDPVSAYIVGTYNQVVAKVSTGATTYVLAVPTIIASDLSNTSLLSIISNQSLAYNGYSNVPASYNKLGYSFTGGFDYNGANPGNIVAYTTTNMKLLSSDGQQLRNFTNNLQSSYSGSSLGNQGIYAQILAINTNVDAQVVALVGSIVNNSLQGSIDLSNVVQGPINTGGYSLSEVLGYISTGINVNGTIISGYNQSETLGWLCFESICGSTVTRNVSTGNLSGYALSEVFGWIDMTGVNITDAGVFSGYGQSEVIGWINFN